MKVAFAGTPDFAARALAAIMAAGHEVPLVLTQPDRPAGRGMRLQSSPVKALAEAYGVPVYQPERLKDPATHGPLRDVAPTVMVVAAYGLILPPAVLGIPTRGCLNIHASLLPRWRGAAPIQRAIEAGDLETGITIMQMDAGLDTGPMLLREALPIMPQETSASLHDKLAELGARSIVQALGELDRLPGTPQPEDGATYARKIEKSESLLDWCLPAVILERKIRAFDPFPGAVAQFGATSIKIWRAVAIRGSGSPGTVAAVGPDGVDVFCGEGVLRLLELQKPGSKRLPVRGFLQGFGIAAGEQLSLPPA